MPNAKVLSEKQAIVAELTEKLQSAAAGVLVDYKGITVAEDTALRAELRKNNVDYAVVKNTLLRFAVNNVRHERAGRPAQRHHVPGSLQRRPRGPCPGHQRLRQEAQRPSSTSRAASWTARSSLSDEIMALAEIPPLPVLQAQVLGTMLAPITGLACVLKQIAEKQGAPAEEPLPRPLPPSNSARPTQFDLLKIIIRRSPING